MALPIGPKSTREPGTRRSRGDVAGALNSETGMGLDRGPALCNSFVVDTLGNYLLERHESSCLQSQYAALLL